MCKYQWHTLYIISNNLFYFKDMVVWSKVSPAKSIIVREILDYVILYYYVRILRSKHFKHMWYKYFWSTLLFLFKYNYPKETPPIIVAQGTSMENHLLSLLRYSNLTCLIRLNYTIKIKNRFFEIKIKYLLTK